MKYLRRATAALWLGAGASLTAAATPSSPPCVTEQEAESIALFALPDALDAVGRTCAPALPPSATLRQGLPALVTRYRLVGDAAWDAAKFALLKLGGDATKGMDADMLRPTVRVSLTPEVTKAIKSGDCRHIDRITSLLAPLPPSDTAALLVQLLQIKGVKPKKFGALRICAVPHE